MNQSQVGDLYDGEAYLKPRKLVDDRYLPYYIRWVQRFLRGAGADQRLSPADALAAFAQQSERDARVEKWQVRQAVRAVYLFQKHYLRHRQETGGAGPEAGTPAPAPTGAPETFDEALEQPRTLIRLRHYTYRTEQTYLDWVRRYGRFVSQQSLPWAASDSARAFLADLASVRPHPHPSRRILYGCRMVGLPGREAAWPRRSGTLHDDTRDLRPLLPGNLLLKQAP